MTPEARRLQELVQALPSAPQVDTLVELAELLDRLSEPGERELKRLRRLESVTRRFRSALEGCVIALSNQVEPLLAELDEVLSA
jgi:hypothetical protein